MQTQLEIRLRAPAVSADDVATLCDALASAGWQTARQLASLGYGDRELRAIAEASNGAIVSGQRGYAHIGDCTPEEINHAAAWLESQAAKMLRRAVAIRRTFHAYGRNRS